MNRESGFRSIFAAAILLITFGQNCAPNLFSSGPKLSSVASEVGNGQGYGGMVYSHLLADNPCRDGSTIESRIELRGTFAQLTRANCQELPAYQWKSVVVQTAPNDPTTILYNGVAYTSQNSVAPDRPGFSLALNIDGPDLAIDNLIYADASAYGISGSFASQTNQLTMPLLPATDANRLLMIHSGIWGGNGSTGYQAKLPLPNGNYLVSVYTWEDNTSASFALSLQGTQVASGLTPAPGTWELLGPYKFSVVDGVMTLDIAGPDFILSGLVITTDPSHP